MIHRVLLLVSLLLDLAAFAADPPAEPEQAEKTAPAWSSVLSSGSWYKIRIRKDGIYKLTYEDIRDMGFSDPPNVRIFGNGGRMLPLMNSEPRPDDLLENPVYMNTGGDGQFGPGDYILFYGRGRITWTYDPEAGFYNHEIHAYSPAAYYFVTTGGGTGLRIAGAAEITGNADVSTSSFDDYDYHEQNRYNFLKSGRQWFGERIDYAVFDTVFRFPGRIASAPVRLKANVLSRSAFARNFTIRNDDRFVGSISVSGVILSNSTGIYANQKSGLFSFSTAGDQVNIDLTYGKTESSDEGFLDYLTVNVRRKLEMTESSLLFRDAIVTGPGRIARFTVGNCTASTEIWDITDVGEVKKMAAQLNGSTLTFLDHADQLRQYVALNPAGNFPKPETTDSRGELGPVSNQNLHAVGPTRMIIVTHPLFREAADSIAEFHRTRDDLSVLVVTTNQVYNEFSSGTPDISAIRDFAKMVYDRSSGESDRLRYLLLLGDGSYNNHSYSSGNTNYILTYQSESSLNASTSYVSDDFFGFMGNDEGGSEYMEGFGLDLGVGRLPAKTGEEAMILYRKIRNYNNGTNRIDWRNNILFVGDDEDANIHMTQANTLADWVRNRYPQFVVKKVLLDAYKQVSTSTGARYPEVNRIITDNIQKGILIYNYTGHGGERGMAAEQILMRDDIIKLNNSSNLPLFVTATCEFSRFDDLTDDEGNLIESTSAGETCLLNENGGSIALLSTTRIVYSDRNHYLNTKFYKVAFNRDSRGRYLKLGDIIRLTKDSTGVQRNKLNFILLGDPALTLAAPEYTVKTDSVNGLDASAAMDTLKAFSRVMISGHLEDADHRLLSDFNGTIYPSVFDKNQTVHTLANDGGDPYLFESQEKLLFKGKASVSGGYFSFEFQVPKDISYKYGTGKIVYYSRDPVSDANGYFDRFIIGGTDPVIAPDGEGPDIALFLNDDNFLDEGIASPDPVIYAKISDESGINTVGNGIGHDITGVVDDKVSEPIILNDYFESDLDDFTRGTLAYPMTGLSEGWHSLKVRVWDVYNNSSEKTITFRVVAGEGLILSNVYNYPNPAGEFTRFRFEHNKPGESLDIEIHVFDLSGKQVASLRESVNTTGFSTEPLEWDLKDAGGNPLRQGVYPYRVRITDSEGRYQESFSKLTIMRQ